MDLLTGLAATCVVTLYTAEVEDEAGLWQLDEHITVYAQGPCPHVDLQLQERSALSSVTGRLVRAPKKKIRPMELERIEWLDRELGEPRTLRIHTEDLRLGDSLRLDVRRLISGDAALRWAPGRMGATHAELDVHKDLVAEAIGDWQVQKRVLWASDPTPDMELRLHRRAPDAPAVHAIEPTTEALSAVAAAATDLVLWPREVDGDFPVAGADALARGAVDDRGWAQTVHARAAGGLDTVELGFWGPKAPGTHLDVELGWVPVWQREDGPVVLSHPQARDHEGPLWTPSTGWTHASSEGSPPLPSAVTKLAVGRTLDVDVPGRDPWVSMVPGKGSSSTSIDRITAAPSSRAEAWLWPSGPASQVKGDNARVVPDGVVMSRAANGPGGAWRVEQTTADAPPCGEAPTVHGADLRLAVQSAQGTPHTEGSWWWMERVGDRPIALPRDHLAIALQRRFDIASLPEPALPIGLKNRQKGWDLAGEFRSVLQERARVVSTQGDPFWPRKLTAARKSMAISSSEAALIVRVYGLQAHLETAWALVRPASLGPSHPMCPAQHTRGLVRFGFEGETRWVDPSCRQCGPFELHPDVEGGDAIGIGIARSPEPSPGAHHRVYTGDSLVVDLSGPAALLLREALDGVPKAARSDTLAAYLGNPGASLDAAAGVGEAGSPVKLTLSGSAVVDRGLFVPQPDARGGWFRWVGERVLQHTPKAPLDDMLWSVGGLSFERSTDADGRVTETLQVQARRLAADTVAALALAVLPREAQPTPDPAIDTPPAPAGQADD